LFLSLSFSYTKLEKRRAEQVLPGGLVPVGRRKEEGKVKEGEYHSNTVNMHVSGIMIPAETIPGMGGVSDEK
jgi:hypothetical protein